MWGYFFLTYLSLSECFQDLNICWSEGLFWYKKTMCVELSHRQLACKLPEFHEGRGVFALFLCCAGCMNIKQYLTFCDLEYK